MGATIFANIRIIDGSGAPPFSGEVRVEGNRIADLARDGGLLPRDGARLIDGAGATLMPGLVEAHAHVSFADLPETPNELGDFRVDILAEPPDARFLSIVAGYSKRTAVDRQVDLSQIIPLPPRHARSGREPDRRAPRSL